MAGRKSTLEKMKNCNTENRQALRLVGLQNNVYGNDVIGETNQTGVVPKVTRKQKAPTSTSSSPTSEKASISRSAYRSSRCVESPSNSSQGHSGVLTRSMCSMPVNEKNERTPNQRRITENIYGALPDINVGRTWVTRIECCNDGVHRMTVAGIHGHPETGCYSLVISGGYEDDIDNGETFVYTGCGGRDLKGTPGKKKNLRTAPQTKDQSLSNSIQSLITSSNTKVPVRVVRGYKLESVYAPETGYRYDGLYEVVRHWTEIGKAGFTVYKFECHRLSDQDPAPWEI